MHFNKLLTIITIFFISTSVIAQNEKKDPLTASTFSGLKFRSIGPAWTSGRIADFAVNPINHSEYYVATASGHLWKTDNAGITWEAIADTLPYSLGCVELDPNNQHVVWVGSGENNHQRALGYGNGVYKSTDGGKTWKNMGLKDSRQIGAIIIDPRNSDVVYVAAEGSAWGPGGDRGLYKTVDGGNTWQKILEISEDTGVNNIIFDPRNPDILYATSEQRRRHPYTKIGGGPESAVYKSTNAGANWNKIMAGLPNVDIGGMGIDISPVNPDVLYLIVEAAEDKSGFFRSTNRGASWEKMSDHNSSGQYYNEIYCDPKDVNKVYSVETYTHFTVDAGKTWQRLGSSNRHVDDHALWINPEDTRHLLIGGDGGVYETFDSGKNWEYKPNLPVTQFYRVNVDNDLPFYNIFGGTQDNQSMGGPSQTISSDGIVNSDWFSTVGGDGFFQAIDPTDPNIIYSEWQYGNIIRYDKRSGEVYKIRPEPAKGEKTYRWYWDTPFILSPHSPSRLYIAAERVFRSDDRGEHWEVISNDLTTQTDRNSFKVMNKFWSYDAVAKDVSTSQYNLITSLSESPLKENLLFAGTDDGIIQRTEDSKTWTRIDNFPGVPEFTPVSDILNSRFDENLIYATFNNHQRDDFKPYVLKSTDKGRSWESISGNLPVDGAVNTIIEDPVNPELLFVGTEWGVFFSLNGGDKWIQLNSGIPKVKVPDLVIQEREKDLVVATFGRGFYVLDDYSALREINEEIFEKDAHIFKIKDARMFHMKGGKYGQGATYFKAPNPEFGAVFTYWIKDVPPTLKSIRRKKEKELFKQGEPINQPSYEELKKEQEEIPPYLMFSIKDDSGNEVKRINTAAKKGINKVAWDLRFDTYNPVNLKNNKFDPTSEQRSSVLAYPGKYYVSLSIVAREEEKLIAGPVEFNTVVLNNTTLPADDRIALVDFHKKSVDLAKKVIGAREFAKDLAARTEHLKQAANNSTGSSFELIKNINNVSKEIDDILFKFNGQPARASLEEVPPAQVPLNWRISHLFSAAWSSSSNPTQAQKTAYEVLSEELPEILQDLKQIYESRISVIEKELNAINAPWTPGRIPDFN
ncbi:MAG: glycosyl hydrolase [Melioribacteraceae bacterium]|nr:glycosyl hydrolase [Melioribacteraceae bacterium]